MKYSADLFKLLSVDKRIEIIERLKCGSMTVNAPAEKLRVTPSAVSQHFWMHLLYFHPPISAAAN